MFKVSSVRDVIGATVAAFVLVLGSATGATAATPPPSPTPSLTAEVTPSLSPTPVPSSSPTPSLAPSSAPLAPSPSPSVTPKPSVSVTPKPTASATPKPTPKPTASATPKPTASQPPAVLTPAIVGERYIITFKPGKRAEVIASLPKGTKILREYTQALEGIAVELPAATTSRLATDANVLAIAADERVSIVAGETSSDAVQSGATWGLDRIDQRSRTLNSTYSYTTTGSGVKVFVLDTGVLKSHSEFGARVSGGWDFASNDSNPTDCNGHGTHVAGTIAGKTYGVAKNASIVPIRVLDCAGDGWVSDAIAGLDWAIKNKGTGPAVLNASLGSAKSDAFNSAVKRATNAGITVVVAAGNSAANACAYSPASEASAITVGASTKADAAAYFSNYGNCLDIWAPGAGITSAWFSTNTATKVLDGTSMAAPHVAGAAARYLQTSPKSTPAQVSTFLNGQATPVTFAGSGSPSRLLYAQGGMTASDPQISGTPNVGSTLTANPGTWEAGATLAYQWKSNGTAITGATAKTYVIPAAQAGKQLTVTVTGSKSGYSPQSRTSAAVTVAPVVKAAPSVPRSVTATALSGKKIQLSWTTPASTNGSPITGYYVVLEGLDAAGNGPLTVVVNPKNTSYTFEKLAAGTTYTVRITARNAVGDSAVVKVTAKAK